MGMFNTAKTIEAPAAPKAKSTKEQVSIEGVQNLAMIDALQKSLEAVRSSIEAGVKSAALERFMAHIEKTGQRPESFSAVEGDASATMILGRKASTYGITDAHADLLREHGFQPVEEVVTPELLAINPIYCDLSKPENVELLSKIEKACAKFAPTDLIVKQEKRVKLTVTEDTLNEAISKRASRPASACRSTRSASESLRPANLSAILGFVTGLLTPKPITGKRAV